MRVFLLHRLQKKFLRIRANNTEGRDILLAWVESVPLELILLYLQRFGDDGPHLPQILLSVFGEQSREAALFEKPRLENRKKRAERHGDKQAASAQRVAKTY